MIALNIFLKISPHSTITVSPLYPLENHGHIVSGKLLYHLKIFLFLRTMLSKKLVLTLPADGHDLLKKLLSAKLIELSVGFFPNFF